MNKPSSEINVPFGKKNVLLHTCCAPCSGAIIECLLDNAVRPTLFFYNPNIFPKTEYDRRKSEIIRYINTLQLSFVDGDYDHAAWLTQVKGLEQEPERGQRCSICFKIRLTATAHYAQAHHFNVFATTLAASRWKNLQQIIDAGEYAASQYLNVTFWAQNWRKGGLYERRNELIREYQFYNQTYCGCEFGNSK